MRGSFGYLFGRSLMNSTHDTTIIDSLPLADGRAVSELSLVEIASRLEKITSTIEEQRSRERAARKAYKSVADDADREIERIREYARVLLLEQRRRVESFSGMLSRTTEPLPPPGGSRDLRELKLNGPIDPAHHDRSSPPFNPADARMSISEAMLKIWSVDKYNRTLTTEEIASALIEIGYTSKASPRSMKSTLNQVLAKLCRERRIRRFRTDGQEIDAADTHSRARKYLRA